MEEISGSKGFRKKIKRETKHRERELAQMWRLRLKKTVNVLLWGALGLAIAGIIFAVNRSSSTQNVDNPIISRGGIHWHPNLSIVIKGDPVTIPANIGVGGVHADTHTHKENDQIHLEMSRPVRENDTRLGIFFKVWGQKFNSECILDSCNGEGGMVRMFVNGEENMEFENYHMKDGDKIEIRYE